MKKLTQKEKQRIKALLAEGKTNGEVARITGRSLPTIARIKNREDASKEHTKSTLMNFRVTPEEGRAVKLEADRLDMDQSKLLRHLIRNGLDLINFRDDELLELKKIQTSQSRIASNLAQMLRLANRGRLNWNERDFKVVDELLNNSEQFIIAIQSLRAASMTGAMKSTQKIAEDYV